MTIALIIVCTLLGVVAVGSAIGKLTANPKIVESMHSVGVTAEQARVLAVLELLGAAGLVVGIFVPFIGLAAAAGLALYFVGAVIAHARKGHGPAEWAPAAVILLLALAATWMQFQR
jgi:uncharacterized membrane protein YphA (DoxX/SURF4 family)